MDLKDDFYDLIRAVNAHREAEDARWLEVAGVVVKLMDAAEASPKHGNELYDIALSIIRSAGVSLQGRTTESGPEVLADDFSEADEVGPLKLSGIAPAIQAFFKIFMSGLVDNEAPPTYEEILERMHPGVWKTKKAAGQSTFGDYEGDRPEFDRLANHFCTAATNLCAAVAALRDDVAISLPEKTRTVAELAMERYNLSTLLVCLGEWNFLTNSQVNRLLGIAFETE